MIIASNKEFTPPPLLRHPDTQNLVSSLGLRHRTLRRRTNLLEQHTKPAIVNGGNGVRLSGELTLPPQQWSQGRPLQGLAVLIHGWEGCSQSAYMISAALTLFEAGFTVFRLNLRDHGDSHHLNEGLFNSTLLDEVLGGIEDIQRRWPNPHTYVAGFSLGGNFALRIAMQAPARHLPITQVAAICPVIDPAQTLHALENARFFYQRYFVRRWRNSLLKKLQHFPHYNYRDKLLALHGVRSMHEFFVPRFTPYKNPDEYFSAYAIAKTDLQQLQIPTHIINSEDDPITKSETLPQDLNNPKVVIQRTRFGSHCAFLQDYGLTSWVDQRLVDIFANF